MGLGTEMRGEFVGIFINCEWLWVAFKQVCAARHRESGLMMNSHCFRCCSCARSTAKCRHCCRLILCPSFLRKLWNEFYCIWMRQHSARHLLAVRLGGNWPTTTSYGKCSDKKWCTLNCSPDKECHTMTYLLMIAVKNAFFSLKFWPLLSIDTMPPCPGITECFKYILYVHTICSLPFVLN